MKLQNLIIIFIIIIIPIVFIFSLYLNLETQTILKQTDYDEKLIEATRDAIEAFEINTTEWNSEFATLANSKRQDILSSINVFTTSLADKLRIGGTNKEAMLTYVPAMVYIMHDGYYIYTPTYVPETITDTNGVQLFYYEKNNTLSILPTQVFDGVTYSGEPVYESKNGAVTTATFNGESISFTTEIENAKKTYKHVLKTFVPYTYTYTKNGKKYTINYTLDNYIRIYGEQSREGYIIEDYNTITFNSPEKVIYNGQEIKPEILTENIAVKDGENIEIKEYPYIYNTNNDKRYYDSSNGKFFSINNDYEKVYLTDTQVGTSIAEYKKILVNINPNNGQYVELYQLLNGNDNKWYYYFENHYRDIDTQPAIPKYQDCSGINYYVENYEFNCWLNSNGFDKDEILSNKRQSIINNVNNNLRLSIANYSSNSQIDYLLPEISETDWDQALSNISLIVFLQGQKIGLKTYNNYAVVTSTENNEYVSEDSLYYINDSDEYYHRNGCSTIIDNTVKQAYRNTEFKQRKYDETSYYYKHKKNNIAIQECFDCIVNRNNIQTNENSYKQVFYTALARERYVQAQKIRLIGSNSTPGEGYGSGIQGENDITINVTPNTNEWTQGPVTVEVTKPSTLPGTLQYNTGTGWNDYTGPFEVEDNDTKIKVRVNDGTHTGSEKEKDVTNIDRLQPKITDFTVESKSGDSIDVTVKTEDPRDSKNGSSGVNKYYYSVDGGNTWEELVQVGNSFTIKDLMPETTYSIKVAVEDQAGNRTESTETKNVETKQVENLTPSNTEIKVNPSGWTKGPVTVTIITHVDMGDSRLQYRIGASGKWQDYKTSFSIQDNFTTIQARLWDGEKEGSATSKTITNIDKLPPTSVTFATTTTTKSITVNAVGIDAPATGTSGSSGIANYYFSNDGGKNWTTRQQKSSYTFNGLANNKSYSIKVKAEDFAGNTTESTIRNVVTRDLNTSNIKIATTPTNWTNKPVTVTISSSVSIPGATLQYRIVTPGNWTSSTSWTNYTKSFQVSNNGTIIQARLWDGTNEGTTASKTIENIDTVKPRTVRFSETRTMTSITIKAVATDASPTATSGMSGINLYYFSIDGGKTWEPKGGQKEVSYTFKISEDKEYPIRVKAVDNAGNEAESTTKIQEESYIQISQVPTGWTRNEVSINIYTSEEIGGATLQYRTKTASGWTTWKNYTNSFTVSENNTVIQARILDGTREVTVASHTVLNIDKVNPKDAKIVLSTQNTFTNTNITATVTHIDNESGPNIEICKWVYNNNPDKIGITANYDGGTFEKNGEKINLTASTAGTYYLHVLTIDAVGNATETVSEPVTVQLPNKAPVIVSMTYSTKTTNSLTINAMATDADGDQLTYTLYAGKTTSNMDKVSSSVTAAQGNKVSLTVNNLEEYTYYYYKVVVTDNKDSANKTSDSSVRTYCPGTGNWCNGATWHSCWRCGGTGSITCNTCHGTGKVTGTIQCPTCEAYGWGEWYYPCSNCGGHVTGPYRGKGSGYDDNNGGTVCGKCWRKWYRKMSKSSYHR